MEYMLLKEVCDIRDGTHNSPKYVQSGYPLVTSKNIVDGRLDLSVVGKVSEEDYNKINERSKVDIGDIIMPMIGTIGNPIIIADFCDFAIKNVALIKFPNKNVYNRYIWYFLKSTAFKRYIKEKNKGGTQKFLSLGDIRNIQVPLISFSKQIELIEKLDLINDIISLRKKELLLLDNIIKARFVEMFGDPIINEKNWDAAKLNVACNRIGDGLHGTPKYDEDGVYPFINGNNLKDGVIEVTSITKMVNKETYKKHFITMNSNTILLSINGTLGKLALYNGEEVMLGKSVCYCNLKPEINRKFVYGVMNIDSFKSFLESNARASTIKNVGLKAIRGFKLILPPKELQNKYVGFVEQVNKSKVEVQRALDEAQLLFDSLMQKYFG